MADDVLLVLNAGSSSLKFTVYSGLNAKSFRVEVDGQVEGIGASPRLVARHGSGRSFPADDSLVGNVADASGAMTALGQWLQSQMTGFDVKAVGHRVVHGGTQCTKPTLVTPQVLKELRELVPLAPLHQPHNLAVIEAVAQLLPDVPQVACFDTSFHRGHAAVADLVPLPETVRSRGVQRYGFHGLSYEYIASVLPTIAPEIAEGRVIVAHLGNGASLCAMKGCRSVDSTLGFTALEGLCMGTRPGSVDPGVILYLFQGLGLSPKEVESLLYKQSGLLGISGVSSDMRKLLESEDPAARLAVDYFVYRAIKEIGSLAAVLGGIDALVFTAGIGENSTEIRRRIMDGCRWLGIEPDQSANAAGGPRISASGSSASAWAIPTDEELMIATHTAALVMPGRR